MKFPKQIVYSTWHSVVKPVNWRNAIGELILIVAGILIALQVNNWNLRRIERTREIKTLYELRAALRTDLEDINRNVLSHQKSKQSSLFLINYFSQNKPYYDSLNTHFGNVLECTLFIPNTAAYETLKSRGLETLSNDSLRLAIATLYDVHYEFIQKMEHEDLTHWNDALKPYYLQHFRDVRIFKSAVPLDFTYIKSNAEFRNVLAWTVSWRDLTLPLHEDARQRVELLITSIDRDLQRLE